MRIEVMGAALGLMLLSGCSETTLCIPIGGESGITVSVAKEYAPRVASGTLRICDAAGCQDHPLDLGRPIEAPDGGFGLYRAGNKLQRIETPDLEPRKTTLSLTLRSESGEVVLDQSREITPSVSYPNGKECGPRIVSAMVQVDAGGAMTAEAPRGDGRPSQ